MAKGIFKVLDEMNQSDIENGTRLVAISNTIVSMDKIKQGAKVTIGTDEQTFMDLMSGKAVAILVVIDKEDYFKRYRTRPTHRGIKQSAMTPAKMFEQFGDDEQPQFQTGDKVMTPCGLAEIKGQFTRGLKWWCETSLGTFTAKTINELNQTA